MARWLKQLFRNERGQAMAEYHVLIPGSILMVLAAFVLVAEPVKGMYCEAVGLFQNGICESSVAEAAEGEGGDDLPEPTPTEYCVPLAQEEGCAQCDQNDCTCLEPGTNEGEYTGSGPIGSLVIKAGQDYFIYQTTTTADGCYHVTIDGAWVSWVRVGHGANCKDISHLESWYTPVCVDPE
jgi:Flp pilus assembly pilin Flp